MIPTYYVNCKGGKLYDWDGSSITDTDFSMRDANMVTINSIGVYALKFENGKEWCCATGWEDPSMLKELCSNGYNFKLGDSLKESATIITGERQDQYGNPEDSFALIAQYWAVYLEDMKRGPLKAKDVAHMMMLFKLARCSGQVSKRDNYIDIQGYAAIVADRLIK